MKKKNYIFVTIFFCFYFLHFTLNIENCEAQWVQTNGPIGGTIPCITVSGNNLVAGVNSKLFLSTNDGGNWTVKLSESINSFATEGNKIYAANSVISLSTNNGVSWQNLWFEGGPFLSIAVNGNVVIGGTRFNGAFISTNNGSNWTSVGLLNHQILSLAISGTNIFAGTNGEGVFRSTNYGANWYSVNAGISNNYINSLAINGDNIYAASRGGIFLSSNNGNSWTAINNGLPDLNINFITTYGNNLFCGTLIGGLFLSTNFGENWTFIGLSNHYITGIAKKGNNLFAGSRSSGVFLSTNNGFEWASVNNGFYYLSAFSLTKNGNDLFCSTGGGLYLSTSNGEVWSPIGSLYPFDFIASIGNDLFGLIYNVGEYYRSSNKGISWTRINNNFPPHAYLGINIIVGNGNNLIAGGRSDIGSVFKSTNRGDNWTTVGFLEGEDVISLAISGNNIFAGSSLDGVFLTTNNGANWTNNSSGLLNRNVKSLAVNGNNIFAGTSGGVYLTTNNGVNWTSINNGLTNNIINVLLTNGDKLFAGTSGGVYLTTNNGANWINKNQGFNLTPNIYTLIVGNDYVFSGTNNQAVCRRSLTEIIGIKQLSEFVPSSFLIMQNFPNPFNPTTNIKFDIPERSYVSLVIYNSLGKEISKLVNEEMNAGSYQADWDASDFPSGVYFYKLQTEGFTETKRMVLLK